MVAIVNHMAGTKYLNVAKILIILIKKKKLTVWNNECANYLDFGHHSTIPNHHVVHFKYIQFIFVSYSSMNLGEKIKKSILLYLQMFPHIYVYLYI